MKKTEKIKIKKEFSVLKKNARDSAKQTRCFICGKEITSGKNSHTIPQFILENITENGYVDMAGAFFGETFDDIIENHQGLNKASVFHLICEKCENTFFQDYESTEKIDYLISSIDDQFCDCSNNNVKRILALIYTKSLIKEIYTKNVYDKNLSDKLIQTLLENNILQKADKCEMTNLTIRDYLIDYCYCKAILNKDDSKNFYIYYKYVLPYRTKIATQTLICLRRGLKNEIINDCNNSDPNIKMEEICFVCFPLKERTLLLIFGLDTSKLVYKSVFKEIRKRKFKEILMILQAMLFSHSEEVYLSPSLKKEMIKDPNFLNIANQEILPKTFISPYGECIMNQSYVRIDDYQKMKNCYFDRKYSKRK